MGRSSEKNQELATLIASVESITASVKAFAEDLLPEERDAAFYSNKVFPELLKQLKLCDEVIGKRYEAIENASAQAARALPAPAREGMVSCRTIALSCLKKGFRSYGREALEAFSSKLGAFSSLLRLPEDELAVIRCASGELQRLVPLLHLAITAHQSTCRKRVY